MDCSGSYQLDSRRRWELLRLSRYMRPNVPADQNRKELRHRMYLLFIRIHRGDKQSESGIRGFCNPVAWHEPDD